MRPSSKAASVLFALLAALFVLTAAVSVPILFRPFYYLHITALDLPGRTGYSADAIRAAYDGVLDFCAGWAPFSVGALPYSAEGASHFSDVRTLFLLDLAAALLSGAGLLLLAVSLRARRRRLRFLGPFHPALWAGCGLQAAIGVVAALAAADFDRAFTVFHTIFFPGKTNWLFDPAADPIILLMPQEFFRNCAILIGLLVLLGCAGLILWGLRRPNPVRTGTQR